MRVEVYHSPSEGWFCFVEQRDAGKRGPTPRPTMQWIGPQPKVNGVKGVIWTDFLGKQEIKPYWTKSGKNKTATVPKKRATKR